MNKIKIIVKKKRLSYKAIAQETGLSSAYISFLANGKRKNPSLEVMQKIASALNEKVENVFQLNQDLELQKIAK